MSSKYDSIQTAAQLVAEVQNHGLSLTQEDIIRAQDIIGHTPIEELVRLANDIGRNNAQGEPDPNGTCSSERRETQSTFYYILSNIWNWEEVTRFWNQHTNPQTEELKKREMAYNAVVDGNRKIRAENDELKERLQELSVERTDLIAHADYAQHRLDEAEAEVLRLKAKLYDLIIAEKESV